VQPIACSLDWEVLQVKATLKRRLRNCKRRIQRRLRKKQWPQQRRPMFRQPNIKYDLADKTRALNGAGLGAVQLLVQRLALADALNARLHLLKRHVPYFESDHVLNLAYNLVLGGQTLNDLELLRNNEVYLDAVGAQRIPDPTTAGDFLRRFEAPDIDILMDVINSKRLLVWQQQPDAFFEQAIIEADGTIVETTGQCKQGIDISYDGRWGYHPLLVSLANTQEPLFVYNRSGNRPSHEGAAGYFDRSAKLCRQAGFRKILFRGDTDFTQTTHLDRWHDDDIGFVFGSDAQPNLVALAALLPERVWQTLERPARYAVPTQPRQRPHNVKDEVVQRRGYRNLRLVSEQVAEFNYQPGACSREYLMVVVRKQLVWERHGQIIGTETRYLFYLTNQWTWSCAEVVYFANDRCNEENLIAR
jgi:Transposase DDE domain group 1